MPSVTITLNGKNYGIECGDGQESRVHELSGYIQDKMIAVQNASHNLTENQIFALTALLITDELFESRNNPDAQNTAPIETANDSETITEDKLAMVITHIAERVSDITKEVEKL